MAQPALEAAHLVDLDATERINVLGPTLEYLTPNAADGEPFIMRGTIPPHGVVPLHSHADPETFLPVSGQFEGLSMPGAQVSWVPIQPGGVFHVPGHALHAFRNLSEVPAVMLIVTTPRIARFFREVGTPATPDAASTPPSPAALERFLAVSARYGYWNASPEENARIGLALPTPVPTR